MHIVIDINNLLKTTLRLPIFLMQQMLGLHKKEMKTRILHLDYLANFKYKDFQ